jgi:hypothetical protein
MYSNATRLTMFVCVYARVPTLCSGGDDALLDEASLAARADAAAKASADAAGPSTGVKSAAAGKTNARMGTGRRAGRLDLSGVWKRVKVENYENFLGAQGATFVQRKLASSLPLVHTFSFSKDLMAFNLVEKGTPCVCVCLLSKFVGAATRWWVVVQRVMLRHDCVPGESWPAHSPSCVLTCVCAIATAVFRWPHRLQFQLRHRRPGGGHHAGEVHVLGHLHLGRRQAARRQAAHPGQELRDPHPALAGGRRQHHSLRKLPPSLQYGACCLPY